MSRVYADSVQPRWDYQDLTLGASGDTIDIAGNIITADVFKDSGGNTLFESNGSGVLSNVNSGLKGNLVLISSQTETNAASISFTSDIDSTYDVYIFKWNATNPATDQAHFTFQGSIDGGSNYNVTMTTTCFSTYHYENDSGAALNYASSEDQAQGTAYQVIGRYCSNAADACGSGEMYLFNPSSTTYVKHFFSKSNNMEGGGSPGTMETFSSGYFNTTSALNAASFKMSSGNFDGVIKMYGLL